MSLDRDPVATVARMARRRVREAGWPVERALDTVGWKWWRIPPRLRGTRLLQVALRRGVDGAAYELLSARWLMIAAVFGSLGPFALAVPSAVGLMVGVALELLAAIAAGLAVQRHLVSRSCRPPAG